MWKERVGYTITEEGKELLHKRGVLLGDSYFISNRTFNCMNLDITPPFVNPISGKPRRIIENLKKMRKEIASKSKSARSKLAQLDKIIEEKIEQAEILKITHEIKGSMYEASKDMSLIDLGIDDLSLNDTVKNVEDQIEHFTEYSFLDDGKE